MSDFFFGLTAIFRGFQVLVSDSKLRALSIVPFLVSILLGSVLTISGLYYLGATLGGVAIQLGGWMSLVPGGWAMTVLNVLLWPIGLLGLGVAIYMAVRLVVAPFYSVLAEAALVKMGIREDRPFRLQQWVPLTLRMLIVSLLKSAVFVVAGGILFLLSLIPFVNLIATLGFVHMLSFDVSDYSFEAMEWPLKKRFRHFRQNINLYSGLAIGLGGAMVIPGMSIVIMPAAIVGAGLVLQRSLVRETTKRGV